MPTINTSREFRPGRWLAVIAVALVVAYVFGLLSATPADTVPASSPTVCTL